VTDPPPDLRELELEAAHIVGLICREDVEAARLDVAIEALRRRAAQVFPDHPDLFDLTYGRRFRRLRTRFRPASGLIDVDAARDGA
jgi:hypothetical protein